MNLKLRKSQYTDLPFLRAMLYEAVFWRESADRPTYEIGLAFPEVSKALADWGKREGDTAVIAEINSIPVGAAWIRYWTDDNPIRGYLQEDTPVLVIGVHADHRYQGIGKQLMVWMIAYAAKHRIQQISLMVSKDNYAQNLYRQQGFLEYADRGDSLLMVRKIAFQTKDA
jgi:ribosomal protein S18 acetylase RimI-like enzyme